MRWCGATGTLYVADFNNDGKDDLLCHEMKSGKKWISYNRYPGKGQLIIELIPFFGMCCVFSTICFQLHAPQIHAEMEHSAFLHDVTRVDSVANVEMAFLDVYASLVSECGILKKTF